MKFRRGLFIGALFILFLCCYQVMNSRYDALSRYQYANNENRDLILEYMTDEEINYLIDRQYEPNKYMNYLGIEGFTILKLDWYNYAKSVEKINDVKIVEIINELSNKMTFVEFKKYCEIYSVSQIYDFYHSTNSYIKDLTLIDNLSTLGDKIDNKKTLFIYEPKDLVTVEGIPVISKEKVKIKEDVNTALVSVCKAAFDINQKTCGNMVLTKGYVSFEDQITNYEDAILKYGIDDVLNYEDYPGQSLYQLGNMIVLVPTGLESEVDENEEFITLQQEWLKNHCEEYGFKFINDSDEKLSQFILKYVGVKDKTE